MSGRLLVHNAGQLVTMGPLVRRGRLGGAVSRQELGILGPRAWLLIDEGRVVASGVGEPPRSLGPEVVVVDAQAGLVMPGLIDAHTHPIFAGSRAGEFARRSEGASYQDIAATGGGIRSTVAATTQASDRELQALLGGRLKRLLRQGVTTVEAKSGYGLTVAEELRLLRLLRRVSTPQTVVTTCLALHAASPDFARLADYVAAVTAELLPVVAREKLARYVDAFVETGYYSVAEVAPFMAAAAQLGLGIRVHADEFSDAGAAAAAAAWGAASADHLQCAATAGLQAMAAAGVVGVILPGTSLYTRIPFVDGRRLVDLGVPVAIASDYNPGSCAFDQLALLATVAAVQCGLTWCEALAAVTVIPAHSLGLAGRKGALAPGFDGDLLWFSAPGFGAEDWLADAGKTLPTSVWIRGVDVLSQSGS